MKRFFKWLGIGLLVLLIGGFAVGYTPDTDPVAMKAKYTNAASQFVDLGGGLKVHVRDEGKQDGPVLLLIHGSNAALQTWEPWVARLGGKYRIISLDLPGHGLTGADPSGDYHYARYVDVVHSVMEKLGVPRFAIAGNSMGGGVSWHYILRHPERVNALILVDAAGVPNWQSRKAPIGFRIARMPVVRNLAEYITPRSIIEDSLRASVSNQAIVTPAAVDRYWELLRYPGNRRATLDRFALVHNVEPATKDVMATIKAPTLILWGDEDALIPLSSARWFVSAIPGSKLVVYPGIGHIPMEEVADQSAADVDAFLTSALVP